MGIRETRDIDLITDLKYKGHEIDIHNQFVEQYGDCNDYHEYIKILLKLFG